MPRARMENCGRRGSCGLVLDELKGLAPTEPVRWDRDRNGRPSLYSVIVSNALGSSRVPTAPNAVRWVTPRPSYSCIKTNGGQSSGRYRSNQGPPPSSSDCQSWVANNAHPHATATVIKPPRIRQTTARRTLPRVTSRRSRPCAMREVYRWAGEWGAAHPLSTIAILWTFPCGAPPGSASGSPAA